MQLPALPVLYLSSSKSVLSLLPIPFSCLIDTRHLVRFAEAYVRPERNLYLFELGVAGTPKRGYSNTYLSLNLHSALEKTLNSIFSTPLGTLPSTYSIELSVRNPKLKIPITSLCISSYLDSLRFLCRFQYSFPLFKTTKDAISISLSFPSLSLDTWHMLLGLFWSSLHLVQLFDRDLALGWKSVLSFLGSVGFG